ncbi:hypothetical protein PAXRUDRAFT_148043, partial [Paxillus rubicundulus Ve08.2h10]
KKAAHWTVEEETAFLGFLQGKLSKFSDGNFRKPEFTAATNFLMAKFPLHSINGEMAGEKTSEMCNCKFKSFKQSYHAVVDLKNTSRFMYCDKLGARIMDDTKEIWTQYVKVNTFYSPRTLLLTSCSPTRLQSCS